MHLKATLKAPLLALALLAAPSAALAASTVIGAGPGQTCYEAALAGRSDTQALTDCTTALSGDLQLNQSNFAATLVNRGVIYLKRRDGAAALADFNRAIVMRPGLGEAHVNRGAALILAGDYRGAIAAIDRGLELGAEDPHEAYFNRGIAHEKLDNLAAAYADYRKAQQLAPNWPLPTTELARFTVTAR
jgi:tetratricopeptide (TPR) repeat protein